MSVAAVSTAAAGGAVTWSKLVFEVQKQIIQEVERLGTTVLAEHGLGSTGSGAPETTAEASAADLGGVDTAVKVLLDKLPEILAGVNGDEAAAEVAEVLQALFRSEFSRGYGDVTSFMSGHLYRCPNGHMYVIGECGGAMQRSRCPECGASIGGTSHQLTAGNTGADQQTMQRLTEIWASSSRG